MDKKQEQEQIQKTLELNALDSKLRELEQSILLLERQMSELQICHLSLDELGNVKTGSEMMAPLGSGIFVKANLVNNKEVLLDVGAKVLCKKSLKEAKEVLKEKLEKAADIHTRLTTEMNNLAQSVIMLEQKLREKKT